MNQEKEEQLLKKRLTELSKAAYHKSYCVYTDFLNMNEISIFHNMVREIGPVPYSLWGGYQGAERVRVLFHGDKAEECSGQILDAPLNYEAGIDCIHVKPANEKFAEELNHRDYLGAILSLGVDRSKVGDIIIKGKEAYVFCDASISSYFVMNLEQIKRTRVRLSIEPYDEIQIEPSYKEIKASVSSVRLDSIVAAAFHLSRGVTAELIGRELVYVNGKIIVSNSFALKEGDIISVRGYGKFRYEEQGTMTKKGRYGVTLLLYC